MGEGKNTSTFRLTGKKKTRTHSAPRPTAGFLLLIKKDLDDGAAGFLSLPTITLLFILFISVTAALKVALLFGQLPPRTSRASVFTQLPASSQCRRHHPQAEKTPLPHSRLEFRKPGSFTPIFPSYNSSEFDLTTPRGPSSIFISSHQHTLHHRARLAAGRDRRPSLHTTSSACVAPSITVSGPDKTVFHHILRQNVFSTRSSFPPDPRTY